jgi:hypothetical protein
MTRSIVHSAHAAHSAAVRHCRLSFFGNSATMASVVISKPAAEAEGILLEDLADYDRAILASIDCNLARRPHAVDWARTHRYDGPNNADMIFGKDTSYRSPVKTLL